MDLINAQPTSMGITQQPTIGSLIQQGAQTQQLRAETQGLQNQQTMQQGQMQRALRARQVVSSAVDPQSGQLDPTKAVNGLYQAGLSDEAQQLQDHLSKQDLQAAQAEMYRAHGGYFDNGGAAQAKIQNGMEDSHATALGATAKGVLDKFSDQKYNGDKAAIMAGSLPIFRSIGMDKGTEALLSNPETAESTLNMLYMKSKAVQQNATEKGVEIHQQDADTRTQAEQDKASYQEGLLHNQQLLRALKASTAKTPAGNPSEKDDEKSWMTLASKVNSLDASSRKVLGVAGTANMRADRAIKILSNPDATPEDKELVVKDLLAVMKGGNPDEVDIRRGMYGNVHQSWVSLLEKITGEPKSLDNPQIMNKLLSTVMELKDVDNKAINDNLGIYSVAAEPLISRNPGRWDRLTKAVAKTTVAPGQNPNQNQPIVKPHPQDNAAVQWAKSHATDPRAAKILQLNGVK